MTAAWYYFGCGDQSGHYLFGQNRWRPPRYGDDAPPERLHGGFDGSLAPHPERELYVAAVSRLGGINMTALAWWDRSVDKRPASNSIIFAPGLTIEPEVMLAEAQRRFPWVFSRLPRPVRLQSATEDRS